MRPRQTFAPQGIPPIPCLDVRGASALRQLPLAATLLAGLCIVFGSTTFSQAATPDSVASVGHAVDDYSLNDLQGGSHSLGDLQRAPVVVAVFMGVECPLAKLYAPRLTELAAKYPSQGVVFLAIDSNAQDSLAEMTHFARTCRMEIPFLKDSGNAVADRFQAERTPEAFVLDIQRVVRYRGRIDRVKLLWWDEDGLAIWYKRLEVGTFELPVVNEDVKHVSLTPTELSLLLGGFELASVRGTRKESTF